MYCKIYYNYYITLCNFLKQPAFLPQDVTLPNSINTTNFWYIFDSGSKFKILKPNSSWLTFGISKFVSLSISHFLFLFLQLFLHCAVIHQHCAIILASTSQNYYHFSYYISNSPPSAITSQNYYHFDYSTSKFIFYLLYQTQHRYQPPHWTL